MIHSSWIAFLNASMQQWKEFADQVAAQERVAVERIATAQLAYQKACGLLNQEKQKIGIAPTAEVTTVSDEEQDATEIHSDGEWQPDHRRHAASEFNPSFPPFVSRSSCGTGTRSQTATHRGTARCRGCPNGFRKAQKYCYAAFWWGKLGATIWCPIAVPDAMAPTAPVQVQPWLHSIIDEWNYKPTWAAEAEALKLAFEVGFASTDQANADSANFCKRRFGPIEGCLSFHPEAFLHPKLL